MLWQKEENISDSLYVDLFDDFQYSLNIRQRIHRNKNNEFSRRLRVEGYQKYNRGDFEGALTKYNESICMESDSEHLSLAYGNRSDFFFKLKMFDRCLIDIQLAKEANYPVSSMSKLQNLQQECMENLKSEMHQASAEPTLSFEPDEKLPRMANVLKIETDELYGRLMKAKCDIKIGETVLIEEVYVRTINDDENRDCTNCGKVKMNFFPCKNCADFMYCSEECQNNNFHESECDMVIGTKEDNCDQESITFILRSVVIGINTFNTINEMMEFVEKCRSTTLHEISESCESPESKYGTFFKLTSSVVTHQRILDFRKTAYLVFHTIMDSSKFADKFKTTATQRFLMHLVFHHGFILRSNSFSYEDEQVIIHELPLLTSYFNHSCVPNVVKLTKGNLSVIKTILPIKRGEQLFLNYIGDEVFDMSEKQRNDQLERIYGFRCKCTICTSGTWQTGPLGNDPSYVDIVTNAERIEDNFDIEIIRGLIQRCIEFLLKHSHIIESKEVAYIADTLSTMLSKELNG